MSAMVIERRARVLTFALVGAAAIAGACSTATSTEPDQPDAADAGVDADADTADWATCCLPGEPADCGYQRPVGFCNVCCEGDVCGRPPKPDGACEPGGGRPTTCHRASDDCSCQALDESYHAFECAPGERPPLFCFELRPENGVRRLCCASNESPDAGPRDAEAGAATTSCSPACADGSVCDEGTCRPRCFEKKDCAQNVNCNAPVFCALPPDRPPSPDRPQCPPCAGYCSNE